MKLDAESAFWSAWQAVAPDGDDFVREYRFHPTRKWRFDFASPSLKVAVEIEGRGRHQSIAGFRGDCEKYNAATTMGWRVYRFPATDRRQAADWAHQILSAICGV